MARKYDPSASKDVEKAVSDHKHRGAYKSQKQAVAVGLSKARRKGKKVPSK